MQKIMFTLGFLIMVGPFAFMLGLWWGDAQSREWKTAAQMCANIANEQDAQLKMLTSPALPKMTRGASHVKTTN